VLLLLIAYAIMLLIEGRYIRNNVRKTRSKRIIYGMLALSLGYNLFVYYADTVLPSPSVWLYRIFGPIQQLFML
jgi:hypothetical protein